MYVLHTDNSIDCSYHGDNPSHNNHDDTVTHTTTESLQLRGSPQLGYYVQLGLGTPDQLVSVFVSSTIIY